MALLAGSIVEATFSGTHSGQRILNVYHYRVSQISTLPYNDEMDQFILQFGSLAAGGMRRTLLDCMPANYTLQQMVAQGVFPQRFRRDVTVVNNAGTRGDAIAPNIAAVVTLHTERAGRSQIGGKHFITGSENDVVLGIIQAGLLANMQLHANACVLPLTATAGGGVYTPVIFHRNTPATPSTDLVGGFPQETSRVMRRRTVGLGI